MGRDSIKMAAHNGLAWPGLAREKKKSCVALAAKPQGINAEEKKKKTGFLHKAEFVATGVVRKGAATSARAKSSLPNSKVMSAYITAKALAEQHDELSSTTPRHVT
ncbi:uncharacterized protein TrAtP1_001444 [Trichoderma atroviride]|uniref:uncharacterized protein n=1 Tax=Hypocrea atroviridis TaxID=63577 RepID=UPI0033213B43|nr:hypothetical protein TrAtP1_001444 [Trichoderma atroviride]